MSHPIFLKEVNEVQMKFILAKKSGMSQIFKEDGRVIPVTLLEVGPNVVTQVKTKEKDGYNAVQLGYGETMKKRLSKPALGHLRGLNPTKHIREFRADDVSGFKKGDKIGVNLFSSGEKVVISGKSIGKGFQGVVKRHGFKGGPASHGHRHVLRKPGSIGSMFPQRVFRGKKMAGRTGGGRVSVRNIEVVRVDEDKNLLFVKGAVPGKKGAILEIRASL